MHERTRKPHVLQVTVSGLKLTAPRHSWSPDALTIISRSACASSREGNCDATLAKPEISWSSCGNPFTKAEGGRMAQRCIWQGGDLDVGLDTKHCQVQVGSRVMRCMNSNLECFQCTSKAQGKTWDPKVQCCKGFVRSMMEGLLYART